MAKRHDWEAIEAEYSAGVKSIRAIASDYGIGESAIRKRAKRDGWQRDLSHSVRSAVKSKLVRSSSAQSDVRTDADIIDSASDELTQIVVGHRKHIATYKGIAGKLAITLSEINVDESNHGDFARSLNSGVDALGKLIKLERQAYNMDDDSKDDDTKTFEQLMQSVAPDE
jgi:hypothetical protein